MNTVVQRVQQVKSWRSCHSSSQLLMSVYEIPECHDEVAIRALRGPYHLLQDSWSLKMVLYDSGCMFGTAVMLQNEFGTN